MDEPLDLDALEPDWIRQACLDFASRAEKLLRLLRELRVAREVVEAARNVIEGKGWWDVVPPHLINANRDSLDQDLAETLAAYDAAVGKNKPQSAIDNSR